MSSAGIPAPTTSIVGRIAELAMAKDLLWNPDVRLVSLLGPGGIGKTRLAVEIAWALRSGPGFVDGVYFVDLAPVKDPDLVPATLARSLGVVDMGTGNDLERLRGHLRDADVLVVLDNFEQVAGAAPFVADLLAAARRLSILVTSRGPLHLRGEHQIEISSLDTGDAVALFVARARAVLPDFHLDESTRHVVEAICTDLDGLPLAIELAAARSKVLSPAAMRSRLGRRLSLLTGGPTDQPERLRSMHATIAWSYDALEPPVQISFRQLSVFSGGWTLDGAESVCTLTTLPVVDVLTTLLDQHLVLRDDTRAETRFAMFETVREFSRDELAKAEESAQESAGVHRRHAAYCLTLVLAAQRGFSQVDQVEWLDRVDAEHDNIRAALQWALGNDTGTSLEIAGAMWRFWLLRGYTSEGLDWLERSLRAAGNALSIARARALMGSGSMFEAIGDDDTAEARYLEGLRTWEALGDRAGMALTYRHLGNAAVGRGLYERAIECYTMTRSLGAELDDDEVITGAVSNLGSVAYFQGDYASAEQHWNEAAEFYRASKDSNRLASILNNLAELAVLRGDREFGVALLEEVLVLRQQLRDPIGVAQTMVNLGKAVQTSGDLSRARSLLEEGLVRLRALGIQRDAGACLYNLALVAREEGQWAEAAQLAGECLSIKYAAGERFDLAQCLELLAGLAADRRLGTRAARLLGASGALRRSIGARPPTDEPEASAIYESVRRVVGDEGFASGMADGEKWTVERAMAEATEIALVAPVEPVAGGTTRDVVVKLTPAAERLGLTVRELEILSYLVERYTDREIAEVLIISLRTVTTHVGRILSKLAVDGRRHAAAEAARLGLFAS